MTAFPDAVGLRPESSAGRESSRVRTHITGLGLRILPFAVVLVAWQILTAADLKSLQYAIPPLNTTVASMLEDLGAAGIWKDIAVTLFEFLAALGISLVVGVALGVPVGLLTGLAKALYPLTVFVQAIPKLALAPLFIVIFGFGVASKIAIGVSIAFFPIMVGVIEGMRSSRTEEVELLRSLSATRRDLFFKVRIYRALPSFFSGLQVGAVFALLGVVVTEFFGASEGMGFLIQFRSSQLDIAGVFSVLIILSTIGVVVTLGAESLGRRITRWDR